MLYIVTVPRFRLVIAAKIKSGSTVGPHPVGCGERLR